jgi:hypothetical protein
VLTLEVELAGSAAAAWPLHTQQAVLMTPAALARTWASSMVQEGHRQGHRELHAYLSLGALQQLARAEPTELQ